MRLSESDHGGRPEAPLPRLLVVSYLFPPDGAVGGMRWGGITKYLVREGWTVHAVTGNDVDRPPFLHGVRVHPVTRATTLNDLYRKLAKRSPGPGSASSSSGDTGPLEMESRLRRALAVSLRYPDYSRGWVARAARTARRLVHGEAIDVVVSSGPPHTGHVVAMLATAGTRARWVVDLRDPWSDLPRPEVPRSLLWAERRVERLAFRRADHIICNTSKYAEDLRARGLGTPVHWVPNAIDLEELPAPLDAPPSGPLTVAYVGTLYFNRDLGPVIRAMETFRARGAGSERDIRLRFAGHADPEHAATFDAQVEASGLGPDQVERLGPMPRDSAREVLRNAHVAVVLAQGQPMQVPAKLYESMGMGVQTLVLAEDDSAAASEARRIGALWKDASDIDGIRSVLQDLATGRLPARAEPLAPFDYRSTALDVAHVLEAEAR